MGCGAGKVDNFRFSSGLPDCCKTNPKEYKLVAEIPGARLVEMKLPAGGQDKKHDHPKHSMYVIKGGKLQLTPPPGQTEGSAEIELPSGAAPIIPPGAHQVKNVGDAEVNIIFCEPYVSCSPCGSPDEFILPWDVAPDNYKVLAQDDDFLTIELTMEPGATDALHSHRAHLIYVLAGSEVTIYPGGDMDKGQAVQIKPGAAIPAPVSAGALFTRHVVKNSGSDTLKMVFFEQKQ
uniref:Cupin 2 conserved barrel domain-containing protein n=1 Tax=Alexandrium monilatum TaxID=311494 RepID=A0A7S4SZ56_9DINO